MSNLAVLLDSFSHSANQNAWLIASVLHWNLPAGYSSGFNSPSIVGINSDTVG
jgi:hypothetical protein